MTNIICSECNGSINQVSNDSNAVCKGCLNRMVFKDLLLKTIVPVVLAVFLLYMAYLPLKSSASGMNLFIKMMFFAGIPFGLKKMCAFIVPFGHELIATVAIFALNFIIGGVIGAFVLLWRIVYAVFNLIKSIVLLVKFSVST